jgi:pimeloyl-ACP methyl ester carboxylesterase
MPNTKEPMIRRGWIRWLVRIVIILLLLPLILIPLGYIYETIASRADGERYPPPGELIDIGGFRLHLHCSGSREQDQPLVVIEAGSGSASQDWVLVQPEIAKLARVCSYDRAGMAWSEAGPEPRNSAQYVTELAELLEQAGERPPYLLVGHSLGVHTVRIFAEEYTPQVSGLVLVDARVPMEEYPSGAMSDSSLQLWTFLARCGFFRLIGSRALMMQAPSMYEKIPDYPMPIVYDPLFFQTSILQGAVIQDSDRQAYATGPYGDIPLVVIPHGQTGMFNYLSLEDQDAAEELYRARQEDQLELSTNSRLLVAENSDHNVPIDDPEIIVEAVSWILEELAE